MKLTILGAHQGETTDSGFTSILIDDIIAVDAGRLTSPLSLEDQFKLRHVLITHQHFDHIKDLGSLGFMLMFRGQVNVYCTASVKNVIQKTLLHTDIWLDFFNWPSPDNPTFRHVPIEPLRPFQVEGYAVRPIPSNHVVPTCGYEFTDSAGTKVYYTGDNGPGCHHDWLNSDPNMLITEVTYDNSQAELAKIVAHLCPSQLQTELKQYRACRGSLPRIVVLHINPHFESNVRNELSAAAEVLGHPIEISRSGEVIELVPA